jgi:hypothetical protein
MCWTSKHIKALLNDKELRFHLLKNNELTIEDYKNYDNLNDDKLDIANDEIFGVLAGYAPFQLYYTSPVEQFPDDAKIYGTKGVYLVMTQDDSVVFSRKNEALKFANDISKNSYSIAEAAGYF